MYQYIIRRILVFIPMLFALSIVIFAISKAAPGDPFTGRILDPNIDPEVYEIQREELGLNDPVHVQYINWLTRFMKGDFGESIAFNGRSVSSLIVERLDNTIRLGIFSLSLTLIVSIPIGIYSARNPYSPIDYAATTFGFMGLAIPNFFFGLIAIYIFSVKLGWFPAQGSIGSPGMEGFEAFKSRLHHLILPGITLGFAGTAAYMRYMRSEMLGALKSDYVRTARAKGMPERTVIYKHTLRNALIPIITLLGFELGILLGGAIITESVFNYPGIGNLFVSSAVNRDYPVVMAISLFLGLAILVGNLLADIFYSIVDPRIRYD